MWLRNTAVLLLYLQLLILTNVLETEQISTEKFLTLSRNEKLRLDEFKALVSPKVPHEYMKSEVYLIRWLRNNHFNVVEAEKQLLDTLLWREQNGMDNILKEDWTAFDAEYKYNIEGCDREGRPIVAIHAGDWDLRRAVISGNEGKMRRYMDRLLEESTVLLRKMQETGSNATQFITVMDFKNFNLPSHACPRCIPLLFHVLRSYQNHYPMYAHKIMTINAPQYAIPLWDIFKHTLSEDVTNVYRFYGRNSKDWKNSLNEDIDSSELTKTFGGTKAMGVDMDDIRLKKLAFKCFDK